MALVVSCKGLRLSDDERQFFRDADPVGLILFHRNCESPDQVTALVSDFRETVAREDAPVLIDQEGGRVQRLAPPQWRAAPAAKRFADLYEYNEDAGLEAARLNALLMARDLHRLDITVNCAPVLDVPQPGAHDIIGDRAHGRSPDAVAQIGRAVADGLLASGVLPVIKHLPGHGRAYADSHLELPVVDTPQKELEAIDFLPFRALSDLPWAMTGHVVYTSLDKSRPATTSGKIIKDVIREELGFDGVLVSDDLGMKALKGGFDERARMSLAAGCDIVLHCSGDMAEMLAAAKGCSQLSAAAIARFERGEAMRQEAIRDKVSSDAALARLEELLA